MTCTCIALHEVCILNYISDFDFQNAIHDCKTMFVFNPLNDKVKKRKAHFSRTAFRRGLPRGAVGGRCMGCMVGG